LPEFSQRERWLRLYIIGLL